MFPLSNKGGAAATSPQAVPQHTQQAGFMNSPLGQQMFAENPMQPSGGTGHEPRTFDLIQRQMDWARDTSTPQMRQGMQNMMQPQPMPQAAPAQFGNQNANALQQYLASILPRRQ